MPIFVGLYASPKTQSRLEQWCTKHGFDLHTSFEGDKTKDPQSFHVTIAYNVDGSIYFTSDEDRVVMPISVQPKKFKTLGQETKFPVIELESSQELNTIVDYFNTMFGVKSKFPTYIPHVTLSYNPDFSFDGVELPSFPLIFNRLIINSTD